MPARIVVVHDDSRVIESLARSFEPDLRWFTDPVQALATLEHAKTVEFLITRTQFDDHQPLGLSLARMVRRLRPDVRIVFTGNPSHRDYVRGVGDFLPESVEPAHIGMIVEWLKSVSEKD